MSQVNIEQQHPIYESYEQEILFIKTQAGVLLQQIQQQESKLHQAKQQNLQVNQNDIDTLEQIIRKFLRMLALIDSYRFFQAKNEPITDQNCHWFYCVTDGCFSNRLQHFLQELQLRVNESRVNQQ